MLRTPLSYQVARDHSHVKVIDNGNRVIAEGMTPQEAQEAIKRCNVHLALVNALEDAQGLIQAMADAQAGETYEVAGSETALEKIASALAAAYNP